MAKKKKSTQQPSKTVDRQKINKSWDTPSRPITPTPANTGPSDTREQPQPAQPEAQPTQPEAQPPAKPTSNPQSSAKK